MSTVFSIGLAGLEVAQAQLRTLKGEINANPGAWTYKWARPC